jgi:hypothetical protein
MAGRTKKKKEVRLKISKNYQKRVQMKGDGRRGKEEIKKIKEIFRRNVLFGK